MATDSIHNEPRESESVLTRTVLQLRQFVCGLHGHESLMHFERTRISLVCANCGHETPGWDVKSSSPHQGAERKRAASMPLVGARRAA